MRPAPDRLMRRILRLDVGGPRGSAEGAHKAFQTSVLISAGRCVVMYLVLPFVLPLLGITTGVGPVIGLTIAVAAMVAITFSMRRFFRCDHPRRWWYAALGGTVFAFMIVSVAVDVRELLG